jgi:hypothetical protein
MGERRQPKPEQSNKSTCNYRGDPDWLHCPQLLETFGKNLASNAANGLSEIKRELLATRRKAVESRDGIPLAGR